MKTTNEQSALELEVLDLYANMKIADYRLEHCKTEADFEDVEKQVQAIGSVIDELIERKQRLEAETQRDEAIDWLMKG